MFRKFSIGILCLLFIVGCARGVSPDDHDIVTELTQPVEVVFWHAMNGAQEDALIKLTQDFNETNEHITVTLQNQSSYGDLENKLTLTSVNPENLPTITQGYTNWFNGMIQEGLLQELSPYINNSKVGISDVDDIIAGFLNGSKVDDKQYGLPFNKASEAVFYNADLFEDFGIEPPTTFDGFLEAAREVSEASNGEIVGGGYDALNNYYVTQMVNRGHQIDETLDLTSTDSIEIINMYLDGIKDGSLRIAGSDRFMSGPFGNQQVAMNIGSTSSESFVKQGAEGIFTPKAVAVPITQNIQQGTDIFMFDAATQEQKTAAFMYMKHLTSGESQLYWAEMTGYLPVRTSVIESDAYAKLDSLIAPIAQEITDSMFSVPANANAVYNELDIMMEDILSQPNQDPIPTLNEYQKTIDSLWSNQ